MARQRGQAAVEKQNAALEKLVIEYVSVDQVRPNGYNPNRQNEHEFTLLKASIQEDGFTQPVIVAEDLTIVDGEHRWRAAQAVGLEKIPVVRVPMEAAQARIATLRHNRARGSEDIEMAADVLRDLQKLGALDWAADSLDISDDELQRLMADLVSPEELAGEEFTEAWAPGPRGTRQEAPGGDTTTEAQGGDLVASSTPQAAQSARERRERMDAARNDEEREIVAREAQSVFRLHLVFAGDEADTVRSALGAEPAGTILAWCRERVAV
jgi:ParB/RepB/Spo0J family partition protein